jgi:hypothetical protein
MVAGMILIWEDNGDIDSMSRGIIVYFAALI